MKAYVPSKFRMPLKPGTTSSLKLTPKNIQAMAEGLIRYLLDQDLFLDARVYYKYKDTWYACQPEHHYYDDKYGDKWEKIEHSYKNKTYTYYRAEINPSRCFEYTGDILAMSFEGPLYDHFNYAFETGDYRVQEQLRNYFSWWGLHYELGYAWSFALYE